MFKTHRFQIIKESMETITQPGGYLDNNIKAARKYLVDLKPDGVRLDLNNIITKGKEINFGIVQANAFFRNVTDSFKVSLFIIPWSEKE